MVFNSTFTYDEFIPQQLVVSTCWLKENAKIIIKLYKTVSKILILLSIYKEKNAFEKLRALTDGTHIYSFVNDF